VNILLHLMVKTNILAALVNAKIKEISNFIFHYLTWKEFFYAGLKDRWHHDIHHNDTQHNDTKC